MNVCVKFPLSVAFCLIPMLTQAATLIPGTEISAKADYLIAADSTVALAVNVRSDLTVSDVKKGASTTIGNFVVTGSNAAVAFENPMKDPFCTLSIGRTSQKTMEVCSDELYKLLSDPTKQVLDGTTKYFKIGPGSYGLRGGAGNNNNINVVADKYSFAMSVVKYTP